MSNHLNALQSSKSNKFSTVLASPSLKVTLLPATKQVGIYNIIHKEIFINSYKEKIKRAQTKENKEKQRK